MVDPNSGAVVDHILGLSTTSDDGIAVDPTNGDVYATATRFGEVAVINPTTNAIDYTLTVGGGPDGTGGELEGIAYDPTDGDFYAANIYPGPTGLGSVAVINPGG